MERGTLDLMARARTGQPEALGDLCLLFQNYVRALAQGGLGHKLRDRVEVSDVVQETMLEAVKQFPNFTGQSEAAVVGWLRRLVEQKLADLGRYYGRVKRGANQVPLSLDSGRTHPSMDASDDRCLIDEIAMSQSSPSEVVSRREQHERLARALAKLPENQARAIWLYHVEGLTFEAVGERMGVSRKAIRVVYARGLRSLKFDLSGPPGGSLRFERSP